MVNEEQVNLGSQSLETFLVSVSFCSFSLFPIQMSEIIPEPRDVPADCIYPALVDCPAPVEAVLTQLSSTMWWEQSPLPSVTCTCSDVNLSFCLITRQVSCLWAPGALQKDQNGGRPECPYSCWCQDSAHSISKAFQRQKGTESLWAAGNEQVTHSLMEKTSIGFILVNLVNFL